MNRVHTLLCLPLLTSLALFRWILAAPLMSSVACYLTSLGFRVFICERGCREHGMRQWQAELYFPAWCILW